MPRADADHLSRVPVGDQGRRLDLGRPARRSWSTNGDRVVGVHAIARDISRQKDAEDRLRKSEARYRSLIQGAAYGIYRTTVDGHDSRRQPGAGRDARLHRSTSCATLNMTAVYKSAVRARRADRSVPARARTRR